MTPRRWLTMVALLAGSGCGRFFEVELESQALCQQVRGQRFTVPSDLQALFSALPEELRQGISVTRRLQFDFSTELPAELEAHAEGSLKLTFITVSKVGESVPLDFVQAGAVLLNPDARMGLPTATISAEDFAGDGSQVQWGAQPFDVLPYVRAGVLDYDITLAGSMPLGDVVVDVEACAEAKAQLFL